MEIAKITGKPKSSVYYHIQDIPLSAERVFKTRQTQALRLKNISSQRKGKSLKGFKKFNQWSPSTVSLIAHFVFDGEVKRIGCVYNNRNHALLHKVETAMKKIYSFPPSRYFNILTGVSRISYFNVALGTYLQEKAVLLLDQIETLPRTSKREFIRAFFDDEGCMDFRPKRNLRQVRGYQKNVAILKIIAKLLLEFGIYSQIQKPNEVVISGKENLLKFQKEINFSPGVYINGNRTNSIWKKHLEKRDLLARAISSYL
jgi:intein/homing endonuclease